MNKLKPSEVKKSLVRNVELSHSKVDSARSRTSSKSKSDSGVSKCSILKKPSNNSQFHSPEMQSTLKLSKVIDEVVNTTKVKSLVDIDKSKLTIDEKVSRKVNFPYGKTVFKDLIPLCNKETKQSTVVVSRGPTIQKDPEPVLADFLEPKKSTTHFYLPQSTINISNNRDCVLLTNGLNLYKILQINDKT